MSKTTERCVLIVRSLKKHPTMMTMIANSSPWDNLKFDPEGVAEMSRKFFSTLQNTYSFFALYANVDGFDPDAPQVPLAERPEIDRWIISLLNSLIITVEESLEDYEPTRAARAIADFVSDNLSNWYVRLNRKRFWGGEMTTDKLSAYQTLYTCLKTVALLMAPVAPFFADRLYRDLTDEAPSVHLAHFPEADRSVIDADLERRMQLAQTITSMALALRRKAAIKVRQPLQRIMVPAVDERQRADILSIAPILLAEINVKELEPVDSGEGILVKRVKPDFKKLGPRFGKMMKRVAAAIADMVPADVAALERDGRVELTVDGVPAVVERGDVEIISEDIPGWLVANEGNITIALDVEITPELRAEGIAREIVNRVQNIRKDRGFAITDRVDATFASPSMEARRSLAEWSDYIATQILAENLQVVPADWGRMRP